MHDAMLNTIFKTVLPTMNIGIYMSGKVTTWAVPMMGCEISYLNFRFLLIVCPRQSDQGKHFAYHVAKIQDFSQREGPPLQGDDHLQEVPDVQHIMP